MKKSSTSGFGSVESVQPKFAKLIGTFSNASLLSAPLHCLSPRSPSVTTSTVATADPSQQPSDGSVMAEIEPENEPKKTIHVKFVLQKNCLYGERFMLVGDDPMLSFWDPKNSIPLHWSEGHVWTTELDVPVGKSIQFKFLLRGLSGEFYWQPGPDRVLRIWDTDKTIVISEDWENTSSQKLMEVEEKAVADEDSASAKDDVEEKTADDKRILETSGNKKNPKENAKFVSKTASVFPQAVNGSGVEALLSNDVAGVKCNSTQVKV